MSLKFQKSILINLIATSVVPFLILGPFFPDLIVSFFALFFLYYVIRNKAFQFFFNVPIVFFFIFCIYYIFLSIFVAEDTLLSLLSKVEPYWNS